MRLTRRNKLKMFYSTQVGEAEVYETDEDGNIKYRDINGEKIPIPTGETEIEYTEPIEFLSSLSMSGGEAEAQAFGLSLTDYDATLLMPIKAVDIKEGSIVWVKSGIAYKDENKTVIDPTSADYVVVKLSYSLNLVKYILKALTK